MLFRSDWKISGAFQGRKEQLSIPDHKARDPSPGVRRARDPGPGDRRARDRRPRDQAAARDGLGNCPQRSVRPSPLTAWFKSRPHNLTRAVGCLTIRPTIHAHLSDSSARIKPGCS